MKLLPAGYKFNFGGPGEWTSVHFYILAIYPKPKIIRVKSLSRFTEKGKESLLFVGAS